MAILLDTKKGKVKAHMGQSPKWPGLIPVSCIGVLLLFPGQVTKSIAGLPPSKMLPVPIYTPG